MANNLSRGFASIATDLSAPKLVLPFIKSESLIDSASRFMSSSAQQAQQTHQSNLNENRAEAAGEKPASAEKQGGEDEGGEEKSGDDVVKQSREVNGPRGPEPTRYGDWERNGRCYDF